MSNIDGFALFCDDIRREDNGKQILIGLYTGDMIVKSFPIEINFSTWAKIFGLTKGDHSFFARIHHKDDEAVVKGGGYINKSEFPLVLNMPGASLNIKSEGEIKFEISFDDGPIKTLSTIMVKSAPPKEVQ